MWFITNSEMATVVGRLGRCDQTDKKVYILNASQRHIGSNSIRNYMNSVRNHKNELLRLAINVSHHSVVR